MTNDEIINIITDFIRDDNIGCDTVSTKQRLDDLGIDSLDVWEIALKIEERFEIDIEDGVPEAWATVQDVIDSVLNELGERTFVPKQGDFVNVTIHSNGKVDVKPGTPPAINRIERADVENFARCNMEDTKFNGVNAIDQYQQIATKSAIYPGKGTPFGLMYAALGLAEAGEVQNKVKKAFRDDGVISFDATSADGTNAVVHMQSITPERRAQIIKELGGVLWYIAAVCDEIGATMSEVALQNLDELCGRGERDTLRGDGDNR